MDLIVNDISHRFGALDVLKDVTFTVRAGEVVAVVGPSGCGKSTLLSILGGLLQPTSGHASIRGAAPAGSFNPLTFVFQDFALVNGSWVVRGEPVRPQDITTTALLTIEGELDDISGRGQTRAAQTLCGGIPAKDRQHLVVEGAGHYGIFSGRRWRTQVYPRVRDFFARSSPG